MGPGPSMKRNRRSPRSRAEPPREQDRQEETGAHRREPEVRLPDRERLRTVLLPEGQLREQQRPEGLGQPEERRQEELLLTVTAL